MTTPRHLQSDLALVALHPPPHGGAFELGRKLLGPSFGFVSRCQCVIHFLDGALSLESSSDKNPTGYQPSGRSDWIWLARGERRQIAAGDSIALDQKLKPSTIFQLRAEQPIAPPLSVRWMWQAGQSWRRFAPDQEALLEAARQGLPARRRVHTDAERHVVSN